MSKQKLKSLGKNYLGENIIFDEVKNNNSYDEMASMLMEEIHENSLSVSQGKTILKELYEIYDEGNTQFEKYASCSKGCGHCCCLYIDCTAIEAELIREYVQANFSKEQIYSLMTKVDDIAPLIPSRQDIDDNNEHALHYLNKKIPCLFLSEEKSCSIYEVRPFSCRKFLTITSPNECIEGKHVVKLNPSINNVGLLSINSLSESVTRFKRLNVPKGLPLWFKNGFEEINRDIL